MLLLVHFLGPFEVVVLELGVADGPYARELSGRVDVLQSATNRTLFDEAVWESSRLRVLQHPSASAFDYSCMRVLAAMYLAPGLGTWNSAVR